MKVLFLGDIVGRNARNLAQKKIAIFKTQLKLDAIIINVENAAGGFGVTPSICDDFFNAGADVLTTGNHIWDKREIISYISKSFSFYPQFRFLIKGKRNIWKKV